MPDMLMPPQQVQDLYVSGMVGPELHLLCGNCYVACT